MQFTLKQAATMDLIEKKSCTPWETTKEKVVVVEGLDGYIRELQPYIIVYHQ